MITCPVSCLAFLRRPSSWRGRSKKEANTRSCYRLPELECAVRAAKRQRCKRFRRVAVVSAKLVPFILCVLVDYFKCGGPTHGVANARRLRRILESLGPAFIKLGQALAAREDILGAPVAAELRRLCDAVAPFPTAEVQQLLIEELGENIAPSVSSEPVAAASLGQVYRISLGGQDFALKVQRPGLAESIAVDIVVLDGLASICRRIFSCFAVSSVDLHRISRAWCQTLWHELDYIREAQSMDRMIAALLVTHKVDGLVIPKVNWELTSTRVLTTAWIEGTRVTTALDKITPRHIRIGVDAFATMVLDIGFVHADPHAGNVLITTPGDEVCLLDFGMVVEVPEHHRSAWAHCLYALVRRDHETILNSLIEIGFFPRDCPRERILEVMPPIWDELVAAGSSTQKRKEAVSKCFKELDVLVTQLEFDLPDYYVALARAMLTLEGIAVAADLEFDIFAAAFPIVMRYLARKTASAASAHAKSMATSAATIPSRCALALPWKCQKRARPTFSCCSRRSSLPDELQPSSSKGNAYCIEADDSALGA